MTENKIKQFATEFEGFVEALFSGGKGEYALVSEAMKYSIADGGKRLRPYLMKCFFEASGKDGKDYINLALAIECIHSYSLVHDDLPCMDNDDMRRGKPSCHKKYGEEYALLAGDGLLTLAFNVAAKTRNIEPQRVLASIEVLSQLAGIDGMIGGQTVDLLSEGKVDLNSELLTLICSLKTGALIRAACLIGCILAGANEEKCKAAEEYAESLGLAFQIVDDILDLTGDESKLGKPTGSDAENEKSTFLSLYGLEKCKELVITLTEKAKEAVSVFGERGKPLCELADYLCTRDY